MSTERRYDPKSVEPKWQALWERERTWEVSNEDTGGDPFYVLEMLPYPSGDPHMGHLKNYAVGDAVAHFQRRVGRETRQLCHLADEGDRRHLADERVVLRHVADSRSRLPHVAPAVDAENTSVSGAGPEKPEQRQNQRGLARPIRSEQADGLSGARNAETAGDPVKDLPPSQLHFQVVELDDRCCVHLQSRASPVELSCALVRCARP